jgi:calcineurin-like phosphoesterase family protein
MREVFFISDTHFGHRGILSYEQEKRPFTCLEEMHDHMIKAWNAVVSPKDKVFHVGDFCFGKANIHIAGQLNGQKHLIMGNHDNYDSAEYLKYFHRLHGALQFESLLLTHVPVHPHQLESRFFANIHGHYHSSPLPNRGDNFMIKKTRYLNVSCELLPNLAPIPYEEVLNLIVEKYGVK